jgi:uncharacterized protein YsxB (DUF464 family)
MTKVTVKYKNDNIVSLSAIGHSDFSEIGTDIVCAAVSVLIQTAVNALESVAELDFVIFDSNEETAYMYIEVPAKMTETQALKAEVILRTVVTGLQGIAMSYPNNIKLYEKGGANIQ